MEFSYKLGALSHEELEKSAEENFGETPKLLQASIEDLRKWLSKSPHLKTIQQDDMILKSFLRGCKYSLERTKEKVDNFHSIKGTLPEWFDNWDPTLPIHQEILSWGNYLPLPGFDKKGRMVLLSLVAPIIPSKCTFDDLMRVMQMVMTTSVQKSEEQMVIKGLVIISDMAGATAGHLTLFSLPTMKKLLTMLEAWPMQPKAEHILNMPSIFETMHNFFQGSKKKKMQERTVVHKAGDLTKLHEDLGTEILPADYGGSNGTIAELKEYWKTEVNANRVKLMSFNEFKTDESKRPGKPKSHADHFGIEGSFRKLDID